MTRNIRQLLIWGFGIAWVLFLAYLVLGAVLTRPAQAGYCASYGVRTVCRAGVYEGDAFSMLTGRTCVQRRVCTHWVRDHDYRHRDPHWRDVERSEFRRERTYSYERRHDDYPRRYRHERACWPTVHVVGVEAQTENGALISVKRVWRAWVRATHGERYQDLESAQRIAYRCWRSSTNESVVGRAGEFLAGAYRKRCELRAIPCLGEWQKLEGDKDDRE